MKKWISILLTLLLSLQMMPMIALAEDPEYAVIGKVSYPLSLAEYAYKSSTEVFSPSLLPESTEEIDRDSAIQFVNERFIQMGVIENKLIEAGRHTLTEDEESALRSYSRNLYESIWQSFMEDVMAEGYETDETAVTQWLQDEYGLTLDVVYMEALAQEWMTRFIGLYCSDITITVSEMVDYLNEEFIEPDREAYENDIPRYEEEILSVGGEAFFVPEGYRIINQILLAYPEEVIAKTSAFEPQLEEVDVKLTSLREQMADALIAGEDTDALVAEFQEKEAEKDSIHTQIEAILLTTPVLLKSTTDIIYARLAAGESFETLAAEYSQLENGEAYFHPDSQLWAPAFHDAAAALSAPGDVSQPVLTTLGLHIIQYVGDLEGGIQKLDESEQSALYAAALQHKQVLRMMEMVDEWKDGYSIQFHEELLQ